MRSLLSQICTDYFENITSTSVGCNDGSGSLLDRIEVGGRSE